MKNRLDHNWVIKKNENKEEFIKDLDKPLTERDIQDVTFDHKTVIKNINSEEDKRKFFEIFKPH